VQRGGTEGGGVFPERRDFHRKKRGFSFALGGLWAEKCSRVEGVKRLMKRGDSVMGHSYSRGKKSLRSGGSITGEGAFLVRTRGGGGRL